MIYERLLNELTANKYKLTPQRKEILKILVRAKNPLSAKDIYNRVGKKISNTSFDTVYRTLATLNDLGIVNKLDLQDGRGYYELSVLKDHHHHMICLRCGGAWKIPLCPVQQINMDNVPHNFKVINHRFELLGYCQECQAR